MKHKTVDYIQYISEVSKFKQTVHVTNTEVSFLFKIINSLGATYKITSYLKLKGQSTNQKNEREIAKGLRKMNLIEETEGKFLPRTSHYRLTPDGLFYILSTLDGYPPILLIKYQDSTLLKTLIYQYFEPETIKHSTARLYSEITQYLRESCQLTSSRVQVLKASMKEEIIKKYVKELEFELGWLAKLLSVKLTMMYSESNILRANSEIRNDNARVALYELENDMKALLSKDNKFRRFLGSTYKEFVEGYEEIQNRS